MTAHVFIVDDKTFPIHLQYHFAGTGAAPKTKGSNHYPLDFMAGVPHFEIHHSPERMLVGMIADICRIRKNDRILFYLQNSEKHEGRFYGIFRAASDGFLDNDKNRQYLFNQLGKSLTFRVMIEPDEVYPLGVTEWRALDEIRDLEKPCQMLWSLIYRKLKGNRGCTMITPYEEERLCALIRRGQKPLLNRGHLNFDADHREIIRRDGRLAFYEGTKDPFWIFPRLWEKERRNLQFEVHLQAFITQQLGRKNDSLTRILLGENKAEWIGNEVGCGVGMQRIDVMVSYKRRHQYIMPIELKSVLAKADNIRQIRRYVEWLEQYYTPNLPSIIAPVLVAKRNTGALPRDFVEAVARFNDDTSGRTCEPLRLVEFDVAEKDIYYAERDLNG